MTTNHQVADCVKRLSVEPLTGEKLALRIRAVLMAHRLQHTLADDESGGHRLVDALTMPFDETIKTGIDEIDILAEEIACHLDDARLEPRLSDPAGLVKALRSQRQIDEDGIEVGVSRQAVCEAADFIEAAVCSPEENRQ